MPLTDSRIDELVEALLCHALSSGADRLTLAFEMVADAPPQPCARCWKGEQLIHHRLLEHRAVDQAIRRVMLLAGLDPWQFRRAQTGFLDVVGRWEVEASGPDVWRRRLTVGSLERPALDGRDWARLAGERAQRLTPTEFSQAPSPEAAADDPPVMRLANLIMLEALRRGARHVTLGAEGVTLIYDDEGDSGPGPALPPGVFPEVRRRLLHMGGLDPWEQGPNSASFRVKYGPDRLATFGLEVPAGVQALVLHLLEEGPAVTRGAQPAPALDPLLREVLEHPEDLARRSVYADVLQERGDARGRFLALQLAGRSPAAEPPPDAEQWCGALSRLADVRDLRFARGFLDRLVVKRIPEPGRWDELVADPHWTTVRALKMGRMRPRLGLRVLREARLLSLEALHVPSVEHLAFSGTEVAARLTALGVSAPLDEACARALDALELPRLQTLELELPGAEPVERAAAVLASKLARSVPELVLVVPAAACASLWALLRLVPHDVPRVSLVFPETGETTFPAALVCTITRTGVTFSEALLQGDRDELVRRAAAVLGSIAPGSSLERLRLAPGLLGHAREGVLKRSCVAALRGVEVEFVAPPPRLSLWWIKG